MPPKISKLQSLRERGFDASYYNRSTGYWRVKCSCCEALVINGIACHEHGCPNIPRDEFGEYSDDLEDNE